MYELKISGTGGPRPRCRGVLDRYVVVKMKIQTFGAWKHKIKKLHTQKEQAKVK